VETWGETVLSRLKNDDATWPAKITTAAAARASCSSRGPPTAARRATASTSSGKLWRTRGESPEGKKIKQRLKR
jgi:hypothetical protein